MGGVIMEIRATGNYKARHLCADREDIVLIYWCESDRAFLIDGEKWQEEEFAWVDKEKVEEDNE